MAQTHILYGWHASYYTGKVRTYLLYKQLPFVEEAVTLRQLMGPITRHTGAAAMPVVLTPQGQWLADSSEIIDHFEATYSDRPVVPATPVQRCLSYLLEAWLDEWWIPMAMHSRWTYPENYQTLFREEIGNHLMPGFPRFAKNMAVDRVANMLRGMCPKVGIRPEQHDWLNRWSLHMMGLLQAHFERHRYLLGERPSLADFALAGPMYGHLGRDPWPAREWVAPHPAVRDWTDRMARPAADADQGALLAGDAIPETLLPVLRILAQEFTAYVGGIAEQVRLLPEKFQHGRTLPRGLDDVVVSSQFGEFRRAALPYTLWMVQRLQQVFAVLSQSERERVLTAFHTWGGDALLTLPVPKVERRALRVALVPA